MDTHLISICVTQISVLLDMLSNLRFANDQNTRDYSTKRSIIETLMTFDKQHSDNAAWQI